MLRLIAILVLAGGFVVTAGWARAADGNTGNPAYDAAVARGVEYMKHALATANSQELPDYYRSLIGYALVKAGTPASAPEIQKELNALKQRKFSGSAYKPISDQYHIYESGVDALFLFSSDENAYFNELQAIANYIISKQMAIGSWDYPAATVGDTSMNQYAALGLWAASRCGVQIPGAVWDKAASWHLRSQFADGGFCYRPGEAIGVGNGQPTHNMTVGAAGTLAIIRMHMYPNFAIPGQKEEKKKAFGVLEEVVEPEEKKAQDAANYTPTNSLAAINNSIGRAMGWLAPRFVAVSPTHYTTYYDYALERACALNNLKTVGSNDWYQVAGDELVRLQEKAGDHAGSWDDHTHRPAATAFAVLFFIKSTAKAVSAQFGAGMLAGGRGLPDDLANAQVSDGRVKEKRKVEGDLDKLLNDLSGDSTAALDNIDAIQATIVEKVQLGDRTELLGQMDRIRQLITNENPEIRRTAAWALGRSGDLRDANLLINALQDGNVDVLVEVYNALCYLSRRIDGVGMKSNPFYDLDADATQQQKDAAAAEWREEATKRWSQWYFRVRPYEERNDLFQLQFGAKAKAK